MVSRAELYEFHASECVRAAERTDDPQLRERYLRLAREWRRDIANLPLSECGPRVAESRGQGGWNPPDRTELARRVLLRDRHPLGPKDAGGPGRSGSGAFP
jgi:hypothetical protein